MKNIAFTSESKNKRKNRIKTELRMKVDLHTACRLHELADCWDCSVGEAVDSITRNFDRGHKHG